MRRFTIVHAMVGVMAVIFGGSVLLGLGYVLTSAVLGDGVSFLGASQVWEDKPVATVHFTEAAPAPANPVLTWSPVAGAVTYELELLEHTDGDESPLRPFFSTRRVYVNGYQIVLPDDFQQEQFFWRVRAINIDGRPMSPYSDMEAVPVDKDRLEVSRPIIASAYNKGNGTVLLYPVYDWIPVTGAASYEIEILDALPENPNGIEPSVHRIDVLTSPSGELYDPRPRIGTGTFYWRVRALDEDGQPLGVYSDTGKYRVDPSEPYEVAAYGDSITHGGGSISYSPSDWAYSYLSYLDFPTVNLAESGDTSAMTAERFERDVLPFHPKYLLILMGSNSLRGGADPDDVIEDMETVRQKCLAHHIRPVFLTLPPVNPANIKRAFDQPTDPLWRKRIEAVNAYVRKQIYIDITLQLIDASGNLPTPMALDGLHPDPAGKKAMADAVNAAWPTITALPWEAWTEQDDEEV